MSKADRKPVKAEGEKKPVSREKDLQMRLGLTSSQADDSSVQHKGTPNSHYYIKGKTFTVKVF